MNEVTNRYRYEVSNRLGVLLAEPLGESNFTIEWSREDEGKLDYKNELPSKIIFRGPVYQNLLRLEQSIYRCEFHTITVQRNCSGTWVPWFSGRLSNNDGTWDLDRCEVEIKLDDIKEEQCFEDNKTKEINILDGIGARRTVFLNPLNVTIEKVTYFNNDESFPCSGSNYWGGAGDPYAQGWIVYEYTHTYDYENMICDVETKWAREVATVPCGSPSPGSEWILVEDTCPGGDQKYARPVRTYGCVYEFPDYGANTQTTIYKCNIVGDSETNVSIDNGVSLADVMDLFVGNFCAGYTFVSNFLQINPDVPSDTNYVTGQRSKTRYITIFQKSDVKRPTATGNATRAVLSFEKLFEILIQMYNLRWRVESGNIIRMEHVSYFTKTAGFNLTLPKWAKYMVGKRKYTYDTPDIPAREEFKFMEAGFGDFQGVPIIYSGGCISQGSRNNIKTHAVDKVTTDVELVLANPQPDSTVVTDDGFVFVAADFDGTNYYIISEAPILGGSTLNNSMAWAQLQRDYYKWDRPLSRGNMNNVDTDFFSTKPTKKGEKITIPLCCGDNFNPDNTMTTHLGVGTVDKATYSFKDETLQVELLYPADQGLTNNLAPVANNDVVFTYMNVPLNINVIGNDTDPDAGATISAVQIVIAPTHGAAVVNPDKTVTYTPTTGYTGDDNFVYRILDDWGEPSNNALVSIDVLPGNAAPVANNDSYDTNMNTVLNVPAPGVFANDSDDVSFSLDTYDTASAEGGTVSMNADGSFTYTPPSGFTGTDTFTYTIEDGPGLTDTATVSIEVRDPDNPVANDDFYTTRKNQNLSASGIDGVLNNDTTAVGGLSTTPGTFPTAQGGSLVMGNFGNFIYVPPTDFVGIDTVDYTALNGSGSDTGTITIRVLPDIYVRLQRVTSVNFPIAFPCPEITLVGENDRGVYRLFFYSNSAGTTPMDITGLGIVVTVRATGTYHSAPGSYTYTWTETPSGTQYDLNGGDEIIYYWYQEDCDGNVVTYLNENFTLDPGLYTVI